MSRRYGRNQKRRAREALAEAHQATELRAKQLQWSQEQRSVLRKEIDAAKKLLPNGSALFEPGAMRTHLKRGDRVMAHLQDEAPSSIDHWAIEASAECMRVERTPLDVLLTDTVVNQLRDQLHFHVEFADGTWAYACTRQMLMRLTRKELVHQISKELAVKIADDLDRIHGGRRQ